LRAWEGCRKIGVRLAGSRDSLYGSRIHWLSAWADAVDAASLGEWPPEDHLVWTVLGAVEQMNLERFAAAYRLGGAGRATYDPR
jgi:hypothetical protein